MDLLVVLSGLGLTIFTSINVAKETQVPHSMPPLFVSGEMELSQGLESILHAFNKCDKAVMRSSREPIAVRTGHRVSLPNVSDVTIAELVGDTSIGSLSISKISS